MLSLEDLRWQLIRAIVNTSLSIRRSTYLSPSTQPDLTKSYTCRPRLFASRVFLPRDREGQEPLPLVIRAHGGGFVVNNPSLDDPLARHVADAAHCCVVSIDYSKAPQSKFPAAYEDVIALSLAAIEDPELPIDKTRVVLCGSSSGGNLLLAATQDPRLRAKILGVAAVYPPVDITQDLATKMASRPDPAVPDFIGESYEGIKRVYFDPTATPALNDVCVSPTFFAIRENLPKRVLLIGAEHDMFCAEDEAMAEKLALSHEKSRVETTTGWKTEGVQWHKVSGQPHAFDAFPVNYTEAERQRETAVQEMYGVLSEWLREVVLPGAEQ